MAAVAELSFLLFALINNIRAEELITILKEMGSYTFRVPKEADFCLISRFVGEEKLVLWNTSALRSQNSTVPEDLKRRLAVFNGAKTSSYMIRNLIYSDSGQYQEECWTDGKVTYERNISIIVCSTKDYYIRRISRRLGEHQDLPCEGAADNLDVQWLKTKFKYEQNMWTRVLGDSVTSEMDNVTGRPTTSSLHLFNLTAETFGMYNCLVMNREQCVSSQPVKLYIKLKIVYYSVEETAVLQCIIADFSDDQPPLWKKSWFKSEQELGRNYSLVLSSLTLNHTGSYICYTSVNEQMYGLMVCPKSDPPAVELFSEGDEVTLRCRVWEKGPYAIWFIKSNQTEGRVFGVHEITSDLRNRLNVSTPDGSLVISNVSLEDTGEYWCAVVHRDDLQCLSTSKTVLKLREPSGIDFTLYTVRCYLLSGLLVVLCVVVVAVNQRTRDVFQKAGYVSNSEFVNPEMRETLSYPFQRAR